MASPYAANREYDVFLTGAPDDEPYLKTVAEWLSDASGLTVAPARDTAMVAHARNCVFAISTAGLASRDFMNLMHSAFDEALKKEGLQCVFLMRDAAAAESIPSSFAAHAIEAGGDVLTEATALALLETLYPRPAGQRRAADSARSDVYLTRSWLCDTDETIPADIICQRAAEFGFRLIGDTEDPEFDFVVRIPEIMAGCSAFIAVLPYRPDAGGTSKWMLEELRLAREAGLPSLVIKDARVDLPSDALDNPHLVATLEYTGDWAWRNGLESALMMLQERCREPENRADVLYLTERPKDLSVALSLVDRITGMALTAIDTASHQDFVNVVSGADVVLFDSLEARPLDWMLLGCAIALRRKIEFLADPAWQGDTLLPGITMHRYSSRLSWLGQMHRVLRRHRRKILNPLAKSKSASSWKVR